MPERVAIATSSPGMYGALGRASVIHQDGSLVTPDNPALQGEAVTVFLAGIGETNPPVPSGEASPAVEPLARAALPFTITLAGEVTQALFLGMTPNFVGLAQANFVVSPAAPTGDVELVIFVDGRASNRLLISIAEGP